MVVCVTYGIVGSHAVRFSQNYRWFFTIYTLDLEDHSQFLWSRVFVLEEGGQFSSQLTTNEAIS